MSPQRSRTLAAPFSSGTGPPRTTLPPNSTDCHHHVYDSAFPAHPAATLRPAEASVADYRALQARLGTTRNVVVQPSTYGADNRCLVAALNAFGQSARGVAVVGAAVSDHELQSLHEAGVRGVRFNLAFLVGVTADVIEPVARRIGRFGWHLQINGSAEQIVALRPVLARCAVPIVFDHMANLPVDASLRHPAFDFVGELMDRGRAWVKLSGVYLASRSGPPTYADRGAVARAFVQRNVARLVWGSDWPHPTKAPGQKPDDAGLLDLLAEWVPDADLRARVLVDHPAEIYGY